MSGTGVYMNKHRILIIFLLSLRSNRQLQQSSAAAKTRERIQDELRKEDRELDDVPDGRQRVIFLRMQGTIRCIGWIGDVYQTHPSLFCVMRPLFIVSVNSVTPRPQDGVYINIFG